MAVARVRRGDAGAGVVVRQHRVLLGQDRLEPVRALEGVVVRVRPDDFDGRPPVCRAEMKRLLGLS
jgi:hypothetical protein